jgi:hypothetical protein
MVTGFVNRTKGKSTGDLYQAGAKGGVRQYVFGPTDIAGFTTGTSTTIPNNGHSIIKCTSAAAKVYLDPPVAGVEKTITVTTVASGHICIAASSTTTVTFDGTNMFWNPSTTAGVQQSLCLMGMSSVAWASLGTTPSSISAVNSGLSATS